MYAQPTRDPEEVRSLVIRIAGDSGDGVQLAGSRLAEVVAARGNDIATFPDFPAEIRAPAGTPHGVSGFQLHIGSEEVHTHGDLLDVLVVMNPAALKANVRDLRAGGLLVLNDGSFTASGLKKADYAANPLEDGSLDGFALLRVDVTGLTLKAVKPLGLGAKDADRCKNFWILGLLSWLFSQPLEPTLEWLHKRFRGAVAKANEAALLAGHVYGETIEATHQRFVVPEAEVEPGTYRNVGGNQAMALGLFAASQLAGRTLTLGAYPITPASDVLHELSTLARHGVQVVQAEDEIAAICLALGASYTGNLGVTVTSGPGMALKTEALGLAVSTELPLVVINVQRGGPSTGLPTKTEQSDLLQAVWGRNGEAPVCVLAAATPSDCFHMAIEAARIALQHMTPVILLSDGYLANGTEPWRVPAQESLPVLRVANVTDPTGFSPYTRDGETLARNWAIPGTPGVEHRIGGLEKDARSGAVSYDGDNHDEMCRTRAEKIARIARTIPLAALEQGNERGETLVIGWGSTYGAIKQAVAQLRLQGKDVSQLHLRHLNPLPPNLGELLSGFRRIICPEINLGQLTTILRARYLAPVESLNKMDGRPFRVDQLEASLVSLLAQEPSR